MLDALREALAPEGSILVVDERVAARFQAPGDLVERLMYRWSVSHRLPAALAEEPEGEDGAGGARPGSGASDLEPTGTALRADTVRELAARAGLRRVEELDVPHESSGSTASGRTGDERVTLRDGVVDSSAGGSKEPSSVADVPRWWMKGDWFDVCSCDLPCPCEFARPPTGGHCEGVLAYHIREGVYGDVPLDGLKLVVVAAFDGNIWAGEADLSFGLFIDERADERQREALQTVFGGKAGGWPASMAEMMGDRCHGVEFVPIELEVATDLAHWRAEIPGRVVAAAEALSGPTTPKGARVQTLNPPGSEVGPGQTATWGTASENRVDAYGFGWSWPGRSSKHIPFDFSGPD